MTCDNSRTLVENDLLAVDLIDRASYSDGATDMIRISLLSRLRFMREATPVGLHNLLRELESLHGEIGEAREAIYTYMEEEGLTE